jgi:hypothetical protein
MDPENADELRELIADILDYAGMIVEIDCPRDECDGNLAWLIGMTRERPCRKCAEVVRFDQPGVLERVLAAAEQRVSDDFGGKRPPPTRMM